MSITSHHLGTPMIVSGVGLRRDRGRVGSRFLWDVEGRYVAELGRVAGRWRADGWERWSAVGRAAVPEPVTRLVNALPDRVRCVGRQVLILVALVASSWAFLATTAARHGYFDLRVYYGAINFWVESDGQIYDYLLPRTGYGFTYPPFAGIVMAPMALVSWQVAIAISVVLSMGSMFVMIVWFARAAHRTARVAPLVRVRDLP